MTKRQLEYAEYRTTEHWKNLRQEVLDRDGNKCVRCSRPFQLQAHHKVYRARFEDSEAFELETLCRNCHELEHGIGRSKQNKRRKKKKLKQVKSSKPPVSIIDNQTLHQARSRRQITRQQYHELLKTYPNTNPIKSVPKREPAIIRGWYAGMYEGKPVDPKAIGTAYQRPLEPKESRRLNRRGKGLPIHKLLRPSFAE